MKVIFCNIPWMEYYSGITDTDKPVTKGESECLNFRIYEDGNFYGYVDTKNKNCIMKIENIENISTEDEKAEGILVIWVAKDPFNNKNNIIGWYKDATVFRNAQVDENERIYNICAKIDGCTLLPINKRHKIVPKSGRGGYSYGMTASNIWFGKKDDKNAETYVKNMVDYINNYDDENLVLIKTGMA